MTLWRFPPILLVAVASLLMIGLSATAVIAAPEEQPHAVSGHEEEVPAEVTTALESVICFGDTGYYGWIIDLAGYALAPIEAIPPGDDTAVVWFPSTDGLTGYEVRVICRDLWLDTVLVKLPSLEEDYVPIKRGDSSKISAQETYYALSPPDSPISPVSSRCARIAHLEEVQELVRAAAEPALYQQPWGIWQCQVLDPSPVRRGRGSCLLNDRGESMGMLITEDLAVPTNLLVRSAISILKTGDPPRSFLGIELAHGPREAPVITAIVPWFPADGVLKVGDEILVIDGEPCSTTSKAVWHLTKPLPGEKITLTVRRDGVELEPMEFELKRRIAKHYPTNKQQPVSQLLF